MTETIKIGARGSPLSLAQTGLVVKALKTAHPGLAVEVTPITTTGDAMRTARLAAIGGKGLFVKEIEEALFAGDIRLAVHSAKDLPSDLPDGLVIGAVPERGDCRDVLVARSPGGLDSLPEGALLGTSGLRRRAQILARRPDLRIEPIRGNVATRLRKLESEFSATLLAAAGLQRLGVAPANAEPLSPEVMLPAAGQGALALEIRADDRRMRELVRPLNHWPTFLALSAERGFLGRLGSGCQLPVAVLARSRDEGMELDGLIAGLDGRRVIRGRKTAAPDSPEAAADFGRLLAAELLERGGLDIMKELDLL